MTPYSILTYPNEILSTKSKLVTEFDEKLRFMTYAMRDLMKDNKGVGIAANQVGVLETVVIVENDVMINPLIVFKGKATHCAEEGCLSLPGKRYAVLRPASVTVKYQSIDGKSRLETAHGLRARIIQHEIDHINGTCICDKGLEITEEGM